MLALASHICKGMSLSVHYFGGDLINIHEWAGLSSNFFECPYLSNRTYDFVQICFDDVCRRWGTCVDGTSLRLNDYS